MISKANYIISFFLLICFQLGISQSKYEVGFDIGFNHSKVFAENSLEEFFTRNSGTLALLHQLNTPAKGIQNISYSVGVARKLGNKYRIGIKIQNNTFGLKSDLELVNIQIGSMLQRTYKNVFELKSYEINFPISRCILVKNKMFTIGAVPKIDIYWLGMYTNSFISSTDGTLKVSRIRTFYNVGEEFSLKRLIDLTKRKMLRLGFGIFGEKDFRLLSSINIRLGINLSFYSSLVTNDPVVNAFLPDGNILAFRIYSGFYFGQVLKKKQRKDKLQSNI